MKKQLLIALLLVAATFCSKRSLAQCDCGTGADGAYVASSNTTLAGGTYNYSSFTINAGVTVTVTGTQPLIIHSTGNITIDGTLALNGGNGTNGITFSQAGVGGVAVAGGHNGANGIFDPVLGPLPGLAGTGPGAGGLGTQWAGGGGAGYSSAGVSAGGTGGGLGGVAYGNVVLINIDGGSGGGSGSGGNNCGSGGGGAGGGILVMRACNALSIGASGMIQANGGNGGSDGGGACGGSGGGSGGTIWLMAQNFNNQGTIQAIGGTGGSSSFSPTAGAGAPGRIRLDYITLTNIGTVNPAAGSTNVLYTINATGSGLTCYGDNNGTVNVSANGGAGSTYTYLWMPGNITTSSVASLIAGNYTVSVTDTNGCVMIDTVMITQPSQLSITTTSTPESTVSSNDGTAGATVLGGTPPYTYLWTPGGGTTANISGLDSGWYIVVATDDSGCVIADTVHVGLTTSVNGIAGNSGLHIYPNPASDVVHIRLDGSVQEPVTIQLLDITGRVLETVQMTHQEHTLNTVAYPPGNYILQVHTEEFTKRLSLSLKR